MRVLEARLDGYVRAELAAGSGETVALLGPNGAGKTTVLRAVAGLPAPAVARVRLDGRDLNPAAPHERSVGYVPQAGALFPHLSAVANVAYGLRARGVRRRAAESAARAWLERLGIAALAHRRPAELSGGQGGRVALARALATEPRILLLDEPLAALDAASRVDVRHDLRSHLRGYDGVCLVVTHDPVDAMALGDRMLVLESGAVVQDGTPAAVARQPRSAWVARMLGRNAYRGTATETGIALDDPSAEPDSPPEHAAAGSDARAARRPHSGEVPQGALDGSSREAGAGPTTAGGTPARTRGACSRAGQTRTLVAAETAPPGSPALATIPPEAVALYRSPPLGSPRNSWTGTVTDVAPAGSRLRVAVSGASGPDIVAEITPAALAEMSLAEGADIWVSVKATEVTLTPL